MITRGLLAGDRRASVVPGSSLATPSSWLVDLMGGGGPNPSGVEVTEVTAMNINAVYAVVRGISETIATLPLKLYRRTTKGREEAQDHPLYELLHDAPNREMTSVSFRETMQACLLLWGNAYAEIERDGADRPIALWPRHPGRVTPERAFDAEGRLRGPVQYRVSSADGPESVIPTQDMLHIPGLSFNGLVGISPIRAMREELGQLVAAGRFGAGFFGGDARPGGLLKFPSSLKKESKDRIIEGYKQMTTGGHKLLVLDAGAEWEAIGVPPEDAQFLGTRRFQLEEVARAFRYPKHYLQDTENSSVRANIEQEAIDLVVHCLRPWLVKWEQGINWKLLSSAEKKALYAEHLIDALLRGDHKTRNEAYKLALDGGWRTRNEVRRLENENPSDDPAADELFVPLNYIPISQAAGDHGQPAPPTARAARFKEARTLAAREHRALRSATARRRIRNSYVRLLRRDLGRLVREEVAAVREALEILRTRGHGAFLAWLAEFYREHAGYAAELFGPIVLTYMEAVAAEAADEVHHELDGAGLSAFAREYAEAFGSRQARSGQRQLEALLRDLEDRDEASAAVEERIDEWAGTRAEKAADREATKAGAAVSKWVYLAAGILVLRWVAGDACPLCLGMHGATVEIHKPFLDKGDRVEGDEETPTLEVKSVIGHPPLHDGCDCTVAPG